MTEETLFAGALEIVDPAARAAYLARECHEDPALRVRVEALLESHMQRGFLEQPAVGRAEIGIDIEKTLASDDPGLRGDESFELAGTVIGPYKLLQQIGEGGMGSVFMAEQTEPVRRTVAVKVVKAGMDSRQVLARFGAERQALALMDHPNIAKVLDADSTAQGRPYFVMELVKGTAITRYCDENRLTPKQRLGLFLQVCAAVQHAHQKGIIHRDLKPSNVLVGLYDGKPVPKIIDFGVAKAIGERLTEQTLFTGFGAVVGTPEYMSPEQAQLDNVDIDTRSDIYSLGILLYELLTGTTPLQRKRVERAALLEVLRLIREEEPPKPSSRVSTTEELGRIAANRNMEPRGLSGLIQGDLDWIVMKCLDKDRNRRYATANGIAADLQRYLLDEPVEARPPSAGYRFSKLIKRNKGLVIAATMVACALLAGIAGTTWQAIRAERARDNEAAHRKLAEKARDRTRDVLDAMTSGLTSDSLVTQSAISADQKKFLIEVLGYYREFAGEKADGERSRSLTANAAYRVATIEYRLGRTKEAITAFRSAKDAYQSLVSDFPSTPAYRHVLALSRGYLGVLLKAQGKLVEAQEECRHAIAIEEQLAADFPKEPKYRHQEAARHENLGTLLKDLGKYDEAQKEYFQAIDMQEKLVAEFPNSSTYRQYLAISLGNYAVLLSDQGKHAAAEAPSRRALEIRERLVADFPDETHHRQDLSAGYNNLGLLLYGLGKHGEAAEQYRKAISTSEKLAADFPSVPAHRRTLATAHNNLANALADSANPDDVEWQYRAALTIQERLAADSNASPNDRLALSRTHNNLGSLLGGLGKIAEADKHHQRAVNIQEKLVADFPSVPAYRQELANSHNNLAGLLYGLGKRAEAEEQLRAGLDIKARLASDFPDAPAHRRALATSYYNFGALVLDGGRAQESLQWFDRALATFTSELRDEAQNRSLRQYLRMCYVGRATAHDALADLAASAKDWDQALELCSPAEQLEVRADRAVSRLKGGQHASAVAEADDLTKSSEWKADRWYDFACVYAVASAKLSEKRHEYALRATELFKRALDAGWSDLVRIKEDPSLDALREREDFKMLIRELESAPSGAKNAG